VPKNLLSRAPLRFGRHVKPLVPAAFEVVSIHQPALCPRVGLWPVLCVIHKEGLCPSSGTINRLMMIKTKGYGDGVISVTVRSRVKLKTDEH
jgi:hypothetical protein